MNITPVHIYNNSNVRYRKQNTFGARVKKIQIDKTVIESEKLEIKYKLEELKSMLEEKGIALCKKGTDSINVILNKNTGFITFKHSECYGNLHAKEIVLDALNGDGKQHAGLKNYIKLLNDIHRQDIFMKGMRIHTYELDKNISPEGKKAARKAISYAAKKYVNENDLFFINNEAFYYNELSKTSYGVSIPEACNAKITKPDVRTCQFLFDDKYNTIGFESKYKDIFSFLGRTTIYKEQNAPSLVIPDIVDIKADKLFAEANRFGNINQKYSMRDSITRVINHLNSVVKIQGAKSKDLQTVKFSNSKGEIEFHINYYDPDTGRSFVYNKDGKYLYQLEYIKNHNGEIINSSIY